MTHIGRDGIKYAFQSDTASPKLGKGQRKKGMRQKSSIPFRMFYFRSTFSIALPLASSSTSLSR